MADYVVCIPSYKRAVVCNERTLKTLHEHKIDPNKVYVYVADKEDHELYLETLDKKLYNKIVIGEKGLVPQRQFIMEQWSEGKHLLLPCQGWWILCCPQSRLILALIFV